MGPRQVLPRGVALIAAAVLAIAVMPARPAPPPQDAERTCLVCHDDAELVNAAGRPVSVPAKAFGASVHGRAGLGCLGCHTDLDGVEDFPHPTPLASVTCARCHPQYAVNRPGGVHGTSSPRLAARPVPCGACHGYHDVRPSSDPLSSAHPARRPGTCAKCHDGAGANFARGRVHELPAPAAPGAPGVVRIVYKTLIGIMAVLFLAYIGADLARWRRER